MLIEKAAEVLNIPVEDIERKDSTFMRKNQQTSLLTLTDLASKQQGEVLSVDIDFMLPKSNPVLPNTNEDNKVPAEQYNPHQTVSYNTTVAAVKVNPAKGSVEVLYLGAVTDGGRIINPDAAMTQIEGALIMGAGYGLTNNFKIEKGINITNSLGKCKMPRIDSMPEKLEVRFTDATDETGPFGSKGIAEVAVLTPAPAICNAVYDAVGLRIIDLPVSEHAAEIKEASTAASQG